VGEHRINAEQIADLRGRRAAGETLRALGQRFGYTAEGVRLLLKATGGDPLTREKILVGRRVGQLTVIAEVAPTTEPLAKRRVLCRCICGNEKVMRWQNLISGSTETCGCQRQHSHTEHSARWLTYQGRTKPLQCWCRELGLKRVTVTARLVRYGWSVEDALGTPTYGRYGPEDGHGCRAYRRLKSPWQAIGAVAEVLMGATCASVARRRGVSRGTVETVWRGRSWRELFAPEGTNGDEDEAARAADTR